MATIFADVHSHSGIPLAVLFLPLFVGGWCLVCFKVSRFGWSDWAQVYRCDRQLKGKTYSRRSGRFSFQGSYSRILNVVLCHDGIGLSLMLPWRLAHPQLLLPWSKVVGVEETNFFFFRILRITISDVGRSFTFELPTSAQSEFETRTLGFRGALYHRKPPPLLKSK